MVKIYRNCQFDMNQSDETCVVNSLNNDLLWDQIADALVEPGYLIVDNVIPDGLLNGLLQRITELEGSGMKPAGVGRGDEFQHNPDVRGDQICWLSGQIPKEAGFLHWMDGLRQGLNQRLFLGLVDYEAHFAVYPAGSFYQKHVDAFRQSSGAQPRRKVSTVFYLNPEWDLKNGGELLLYDEAGKDVLLSVAPECGRLVVFMSEKIPHEVKVASQNRRSIAGWFRAR